MVAVASKGSAVVTLPTDTQILITREFDAPKHLVYRAFTEPDLIERWWSGERGKVTSVEVDLRVGGRWRYVMTANEGFEVAFHGEFKEIVANERIVNTEVFEGAPPGAPADEGAESYPADDEGALITTTFSEADGRTVLTQLTECGTREIRDLIIESGMEGGMQEAMDKLEDVAVSLDDGR
jgi:uncharacterized protein YndB with AHSA1/START domain